MSALERSKYETYLLQLRSRARIARPFCLARVTSGKRVTYHRCETLRELQKLRKKSGVIVAIDWQQPLLARKFAAPWDPSE